MLKPCSKAHNCASTEATNPRHTVAPLRLKPGVEEAWPQIRSVVLALPRTTVVSERENYLHAECRSSICKFVDDLELELQPKEELIAARSASRLGYYDFGVNRKRLEQLRQMLGDRGLLDENSPGDGGRSGNRGQ